MAAAGNRSRRDPWIVTANRVTAGLRWIVIVTTWWWAAPPAAQADGCPSCSTDSDCLSGQHCTTGYCTTAPPGCGLNNATAHVMAIFDPPVPQGDEICFRVIISNVGDDNCDAVNFSANLYLPDCQGNPACPGGTVIPITDNACIEQGESFQCPGPDARCLTLSDCPMGLGYQYLVNQADAIGPPLPGTCPPLPSNDLAPRYVSAFVLSSCDALLEVPVAGTTCKVGLVPVPRLGDLNVDGKVDAEDLMDLLGLWGLCPGCAADLNGDGAVDPEDLAILLGNFG